MNYSRQGVIEKQKRIKSVKRKLAMKTGVAACRVALVLFVAFGVIGGFAGWGALKGILDKAPGIETINIVPTGYFTTIYDADGHELNKIVGAGANRKYVTLDKIPDHVQEAFIAIEDVRFYDHNGIDVKGIFRAAFVGLSSAGSFSEGGSTITQQLLKNQVFSGGNEESFILKAERKVQEQYLAIQLENKFTKDEILEYYLNSINLGQNSLGVQTAANRYFNKDVSKLTISEAAVIAATTKSPSGYNPITNPENNAERRDKILKNMLDEGYISDKQFAKASADDVYARIQAVNKEVASGVKTNSYYVDETILQVLEDLQTKAGYTYTQANNLIYSGGLSIYSNMDPEIQEICDRIISDESYYEKVKSKWQLTYALSVQKKDGTTVNYSEGHIKKELGLEEVLFNKQEDALPYIDQFKEKVIEKDDTILGERYNFTIEPQVSFCLMEPSTGQVKAIVGGRGDKTGNLTLNRAGNDVVRQPGSLFKVLSTYIPAFDTTGLTLADVMDDTPYWYPNSDVPVQNFWGTSYYEGLTSLRRAISRSINIVTLKALEKVGIPTSLDYLNKLGITSLTEEDANYSIGIGGLTNGISNLEATAAFASIANHGVYVEPTFYSKVLDHDGKVILESKPASRQVMKESTAYLLTSAMEDTLSGAGGSSTQAKMPNTKMGQAAKSGSTNSYNDIWLCGYTPYYIGTVWSGFDNGGSQSSFSSYHKFIWRDIMTEIHKNLEPVAFEVPDSVTRATICTKCGKLAVSGVCDKAPNKLSSSSVRTEYFAVGTVPAEKCTCHVKLRICKVSGELASEKCPPTDVTEKIYLIKDETLTRVDKNGNNVSMKYKTWDTDFIMPAGLQDTVCEFHMSGGGVEPEPDPKPEDPETPAVKPETPTEPIEPPADVPEDGDDGTTEPPTDGGDSGEGSEGGEGEGGDTEPLPPDEEEIPGNDGETVE